MKQREVNQTEENEYLRAEDREQQHNIYYGSSADQEGR
jgi:hypothetical protein